MPRPHGRHRGLVAVEGTKLRLVEHAARGIERAQSQGLAAEKGVVQVIGLFLSPGMDILCQVADAVALFGVGQRRHMGRHPARVLERHHSRDMAGAERAQPRGQAVPLGRLKRSVIDQSDQRAGLVYRQVIVCHLSPRDREP
jgi:hypothetical protein